MASWSVMFGIFRFVLAVNVVIYHVLGVPAIGPYAVYSFFVLSGFLMTMIMQETYGYSLKGFKSYAINRFLRLFPVYWALLFIIVIVILIVGESFSLAFHPKMIIPNEPSSWMANLFMVYPSFEPSLYPVRLAPATWALTIELFFYLTIGLGLSKSKQLTTMWFLLSLSWVLWTNFSNSEWGIGYGDIIVASLPFSLGALVYHYKSLLNSIISKVGIVPILTLFTLNILVVAISYYIVGDKFWFFNALGEWVNLIFSGLVTILLLEHGRSFLPKKIDRYLGDLSYPIYIFHWSGASLASWLIGSNHKGWIFLWGLSLTILVSIFVNRVVNDNVEKLRNIVRPRIEKQEKL
jgi:peptidoglycan/LPS O-acetylase OafA/YrhL